MNTAVTSEKLRFSQGRTVPDEKSFYKIILKPVENRMLRSIWRIVRNAEAAEDTLQDALTIIWRKRARITHHPNPEALILKICTDSAYDTLRKIKRNSREYSPTVYSELSKKSKDSLAENMERENITKEILQEISRLPKNQATAVLMRIIQEQPYSAIAQTLGCGEGSARVLVSRGRTRLSSRLTHLRSKTQDKEIK